MRKLLIKKVAIYVLLLFSWSILTNGINFADNGDKDPIAKAEQLFKDMQYDDAIKTLNDFIAIYKSKDNEKLNISHKIRIANAYSLLARIYFSISETEHKEKIHENIKNSLKYNINHKVKTVNIDFEALYNIIKEELISQNPQTKPVDKKVSLKNEILLIFLLFLGIIIAAFLLYYLVFLFVGNKKWRNIVLVANIFAYFTFTLFYIDKVFFDDFYMDSLEKKSIIALIICMLPLLLSFGILVFDVIRKLDKKNADGRQKEYTWTEVKSDLAIMGELKYLIIFASIYGFIL